MKSLTRKSIQTAALVLLSAATLIDAQAQTARVQIIHNAADPAADTVDVYLGETLALDDFAFREATPFIDLPASSEIVIGIAPGSSTSSADVIASFPVTLDMDRTYTIVANGVLDPSSFAANPDGRETGFTLWIKADTREAADDAGMIDFFAAHGSSDAPTVDVVARGVATLVDSAAYGDITDYLSVPPASFILDVRPAGDPTIVAAFDLDLTGLAGGAAAIVASGFLDPSSNQEGPAFGLIAVLPDGSVVEPKIVTATEEFGAEVPGTFRVDGNYPNPFNPSTNVRFDLPSASTVNVQVFDMLGRQVLSTPPTELAAGAVQSIRINAIDLPSGTYVYRVSAKSAGTEVFDTGTMLLLK
jgi:hypothetical protein